MARENFNRSLDVTLKHEGGYVNHPKDPGGHTNKGVTLTTLRRYQSGASVNDLKSISTDMLRRIYRDGYWDKVSGDTLAAGVDLATFDYAVNSGPAAAKKSLLAVVGGKPADTVKKLCARRLSIYRTFTHWSTFGKGWTSRIVAIEAKGVAWALAALPAMEAPAVKDALVEAGVKAGNQSAKDGAAGGSAATGAGGAVIVGPDQVGDATQGWVLLAVLVAALGIAAFVLIRRARINGERRDAYVAEADAMGEA